MKNILVPTEFSEQTKYVLDFACQIARKNKAKIYLLHIIDTFEDFVWLKIEKYADQSAYKQLIEQAQTYADFELKTMYLRPEYEGIEFEAVVEFGDFLKKTKEFISKWAIDMTLMGSKGVHGLDEMLIGSNAAKLIRNVNCPVLTVKNELRLDKINKVVFASEFKEDNLPLFLDFKKFIELFDTELYFLKVHTPTAWATTRHATSLIKRFAEHHNVEKYHLSIYNDVDVETGIHNFCQDIAANLIGMTTHSPTGVNYLLNGSLTGEVVSHTQRAIWTISRNKKN